MWRVESCLHWLHQRSSHHPYHLWTGPWSTQSQSAPSICDRVPAQEETYWLNPFTDPSIPSMYALLSATCLEWWCWCRRLKLHLQPRQVGGSLPVLVVTDTRHARETDGDSIGCVHLWLGKLRSCDLPHWCLLFMKYSKMSWVIITLRNVEISKHLGSTPNNYLSDFFLLS